HVGSAQDNDGERKDFYTDVNSAKEFVKRTNVDCLAVAIGTAHGNYPLGVIPKLDFNRLREIKEALKIPLVLHGASGAGEENIKKAVSFSINKINVYTDLINHARNYEKMELNSNPEIDYMELQSLVEN